MKTCPYCAEEIQDAAVKCRHCGEVTVSQEWRKFCADYSTWPAGKRTDEFQALSDDQKAEFNAAWTALGLDKAPQATPAPTEGATAKGFKGVIGVVLGLGCISIVLPVLFFGGLGALMTCVGLGSLAVPDVDEAQREESAESRGVMVSEVRTYYERAPIGGGWTVDRVWFHGGRVRVKVGLPSGGRFPTKGVMGKIACPGKLESAPVPMLEIYVGGYHFADVDCYNWRR